MKKIKVIAFDWGGVLIDDPGEKMKVYCARKLGVKENELKPLFDKYVADFHTGRITEKKIWRNISRGLGIRRKIDYSLWARSYRPYYSPRPKMFELVKRLRRAGYKVILLTNTEKPIITYAKKRYHKDMRPFNAIIASCDVGTMKPGKKIYEIMLKRLKTPPAETLFIDDREINIIGAKKIGIKSILFKNYTQLLRELRRYKINYYLDLHRS